MRDDETEVWAALRTRLWPDCGPEDNAADIANWQSGGSIKIVFLAFENDAAIGFAEISERSVVDGCAGAQAYLEGWYVDPAYQKRGLGGALIAAAANWARDNGYTHLGSDVELDNRISQKAHGALGFVEAGRVINYVKALV